MSLWLEFLAYWHIKLMKFLVVWKNLLGCPEWPDPDLAAKLGAYERTSELPGAARSAATGSERQPSFNLNEFRNH